MRSLAIFPAAGNHEYASRGKGIAAFMQYFRWPLALPDDDPPWYSFDIGATHFVALDSNSYKSPRQLGWFDHDLREARRRGARAMFVYAHEGPASSGMHGDNAICARDYVPVMERNRVSMFFGGHDHDYERGRIGTLDYVVTGGGGAELRPRSLRHAGQARLPAARRRVRQRPQLRHGRGAARRCSASAPSASTARPWKPARSTRFTN